MARVYAKNKSAKRYGETAVGLASRYCAACMHSNVWDAAEPMPDSCSLCGTALGGNTKCSGQTFKPKKRTPRTDAYRAACIGNAFWGRR